MALGSRLTAEHFRSAGETDRFEWCMAAVYAWEVGPSGEHSSDHPDDPGGETRFGISRKNWPDQFEKIETWEDAKAFYREHFYKPGIYEAVGMSALLARSLLLLSIHAGEKRAIRTLQLTINAFLRRNQALIDKSNIKVLHVDGILGPKTHDALLECSNFNSGELVTLFRLCVEQFYSYLIDTRPSLASFAENWLKRAKA